MDHGSIRTETFSTRTVFLFVGFFIDTNAAAKYCEEATLLWLKPLPSGKRLVIVTAILWQRIYSTYSMSHLWSIEHDAGTTKIFREVECHHISQFTGSIALWGSVNRHYSTSISMITIEIYASKTPNKLKKVFAFGSMADLYGCDNKVRVTASERFDVYCRTSPVLTCVCEPARINLTSCLKNEMSLEGLQPQPICLVHNPIIPHTHNHLYHPKLG